MADGGDFDGAESLVGTWKQNSSADDDTWMEAGVKDDVITGEWVEDWEKNAWFTGMRPLTQRRQQTG